MDTPNFVEIIEAPFSLQFFKAAVNLRKTLDAGVTSVRDAGGADLGRQDGGGTRA